MNWWTNHGTKLLGGAVAAVGVAQTIDPALLSAIAGPQAAAVVTVLGGLATLFRGFKNTQAQKDQSP